MQPYPKIVTNAILYEDTAVQITENEIVIKKYFFPIPIDKKVAFHEIHDVFLLTKSKSQCGLNDLNPFSSSSEPKEGQKTLYIEIWLKDSKSRPSFELHDPQKVFKLIQKKVRNEEFKENINLGMDSIKKSVKNIESGFFSKMGKIMEQTTNKISAQGQKWSEELKLKSSENRV